MMYNAGSSARQSRITESSADRDATGSAIMKCVGDRARVLNIAGGPNVSLRDRLNATAVDVVDVDGLAPTAIDDIVSAIAAQDPDAIVLDGTLAVCADPARMLQQIASSIRAKTLVVASLPHVGHASVRRELMSGRSTVSRIADDSTLRTRLFNQRLGEDLFALAGFHVDQVSTVSHVVTGDFVVEGAIAPAMIGRPYLEKLFSENDANILGFVFSATPIARESAGGISLHELLSEETTLARTSSLVSTLSNRTTPARTHDAIAMLAEALEIAGEQERDLQRLSTDHRSAVDERESALTALVALKSHIASDESAIKRMSDELESLRAALAVREASFEEASRQITAVESTLAEKSAELVLRTDEFEDRFGDFQREIKRIRDVYEAQHAQNVATIFELQERVVNANAEKTAELTVRAGEFEERFGDFQREIARIHDVYEAQHAQNVATIVELQERILGVDCDAMQSVAAVERANAELHQQIDTMQARIVALDGVLHMAREERSELSLAYREVENQLIEQTRALIEQTRDELETLARITNSTHASRFWKIKLLIVGARARFRFGSSDHRLLH